MEGVTRFFKSTREYLTPVLSSSAFESQGMLTPEEFVLAGDHLVASSPAWSWESVQNPSHQKSFLPANKQFLVTKGVPCFHRVLDLHSGAILDEDVYLSDDEDDEEGRKGREGEEEEDGTLVDIEGDDVIINENRRKHKDGWCHSRFDISRPVDTAESPKRSPPVIGTASGEGVEYLDMEDESLALDGDTLVAADGEEGGSGVIAVRRYDVSLTYDNYYRVPRVWLFGYDEKGSLLDPEAMFEDVIQDYAKRTVTIDPHPHNDRICVSIHPCQHAAAMLKILEASRQAGHPLTVEQYLIIFLKFVQGVIPTIEYDYTSGVSVHA